MTIVFAGRSTFDLGYVCPEYPAENGKLSATRFWAGAGGCALNAAVTARALGSDVRLLTLLGTGPFADAVRGGGEGDPNPVQDHGFMYGRSFTDPDGHIWELAWMDVEAALSAGAETAA